MNTKARRFCEHTNFIPCADIYTISVTMLLATIAVALYLSSFIASLLSQHVGSFLQQASFPVFVATCFAYVVSRLGFDVRIEIK